MPEKIRSLLRGILLELHLSGSIERPGHKSGRSLLSADADIGHGWLEAALGENEPLRSFPLPLRVGDPLNLKVEAT